MEKKKTKKWEKRGKFEKRKLKGRGAYFAFWLGIKKKGARKKESEKKGKKREKKENWGNMYGGQDGHIMPFWLGYT